MARLLLDHGADANAVAANGRTPLHIASINGMVELVETLLLGGVDIGAVDEMGLTPL